MDEEQTIYIELVLDNGKLVQIACPLGHEDQLYESIDNAIQRGDWWSPTQFDGCTAEYMGLSQSRIAMRRVVGML